MVIKPFKVDIGPHTYVVTPGVVPPYRDRFYIRMVSQFEQARIKWETAREVKNVLMAEMHANQDAGKLEAVGQALNNCKKLYEELVDLEYRVNQLHLNTFLRARAEPNDV